MLTHTVRPGDTVAAIAALYGTTVQAILRANPTVNPNFLYAGQVLVIPVSAAPAPYPTSPQYPQQGGSLERRVTRLEREVERLNQRVRRLEQGR